MTRALIANTEIHGTRFTDTILTQTGFENVDLHDPIMGGTEMTKNDLYDYGAIIAGSVLILYTPDDEDYRDEDGF